MSTTTTDDLAHYADHVARKLPGTWHGTAKTAFVGKLSRIDGGTLSIFRAGTRIDVTAEYPDGRKGEQAGMDYNRGPEHAANQIIRRILPSFDRTFPEASEIARRRAGRAAEQKRDLADWLVRARATAPRTSVHETGTDGFQQVTCYIADSRITASIGTNGLPASELRVLGTISGPALLEIIGILARDWAPQPAYASV